MNTKVKLSVEIEFSDKVISDTDIEEVVNNVMDGLIDRANHHGIAPIDYDVFTKAIKVSDNHGTERNYKFNF